jgi:hypothetical protein
MPRRSIKKATPLSEAVLTAQEERKAQLFADRDKLPFKLTTPAKENAPYEFVLLLY